MEEVRSTVGWHVHVVYKDIGCFLIQTTPPSYIRSFSVVLSFFVSVQSVVQSYSSNY
jgi:hypothetical protein